MTNPNLDIFCTILRAQHPLVWCPTSEDVEASEMMISAALKLQRPIRRWSSLSGLIDGSFIEDHAYVEETTRPEVALLQLRDHEAGSVIVLQDLRDHLDSPVILRALREVVATAARLGSTVVLIDHRHDLPDPLPDHALRIALQMPEGAEVDRIARDTLRRFHQAKRTRLQIRPPVFATLVEGLRGLSRRQIRQIITAIALETGCVDDGAVERASALRRSLIHRPGLLEPIPTQHGWDRLAGFQRFRQWFEHRHPQRLPTDLPHPRGVLVLGVPGSGKSYSVRCAAHEWGLPLLRLDAGSLYDSYIGASEQRLRECLQQAEAMAPCMLWIDEIEKAFASAASRSSDGGLSQRMFGHFLTWLQDRSEPVFVFATANDIQALPPELLRKGRFDEIFFVDLPDAEVRQQLLQVHAPTLAGGGEEARLVDASDGFTGAEIEQAVTAARFQAQSSEIGRDDLLSALQASPPLAVTMRETIDGLRKWAEGRCVPAHR